MGGYHQLFGHEHAAIDDLLRPCYVNRPGLVQEKPILVGKWGTGKTGLLIHRNRPLSDALKTIEPSNPEIDRIWYLDETAIQLQTLQHIEVICGSDQSSIKRLLEDLWRGEIVRCAVKILSTMYDFYGAPSGDHWKKVTSTATRMERSTIWDLVPRAIGILGSKEQNEAMAALINQLRSIDTQGLQSAVHLCLADIQDHPVQPVVGIEPIETPNSEVEQQTDLAELLVTCLLNVFYKYFQPSSRQLLRVEISIPWHRYMKNRVGEPQKLAPYEGHFRWTPASLKEFINARIEYEFRRVRRSFTATPQNDAWSALFADRVKNANHSIQQSEDTFSYVLRHSQYRVRDILRLTREAVEYEASVRGVSVDDVVSSRHLRVTERSIRASIRRTCKQTAEERVLEAGRRFQDFASIIEAVRGISVPFTVADLKRRIQKRGFDRPDDIVLKHLDTLWSGGVLGLQIRTRSPQSVSQVSGAFGPTTRSSHLPGANDGVFYLFAHTTDRRAHDIISTYDAVNGQSDEADTDVKLVVHPMMFEYLDIRINETHPVGV